MLALIAVPVRPKNSSQETFDQATPDNSEHSCAATTSAVAMAANRSQEVLDFCYHCGGKLEVSAPTCPHCNKKL